MTTHILLDFETFSECDLRKHGLYRYAQDPTTELLCVAWKYQDQPTIYGQDFEDSWSFEFLHLVERLEASDTIIHAHNAVFERQMITHVLPRQYQVDRVPAISQYRCSMAQGLMCGLPGSLDQLGKSLGLTVQKDSNGYTLMLKMCKPNKAGARVDSTELRQRLLEYCKTDVRVEAGIEALLPLVPPAEQRLWELTEKMNDRGVFIDTYSAESLSLLMEKYGKDLDERCRYLTFGPTGRQVAKLKATLATMGLTLKTFQKKDLEVALDIDPLDPDIQEILHIRQESSKSSTSKITKMHALMNADRRVRGNFLWHGASTGRWSGRGLQVQNLAKPTVKGVETIIECANTRDLDTFKLIYSKPAEAFSSAVRGLICAENGVLYSGDFSAVEARMLAFLARDEESLAAYHRREDVYRVLAAEIYGVPLAAVTPKQRQMGKQGILGCGYQLGGEGFQKMLANMYGIFIDRELADHVVATYRKAHPEVTQLWYDLNDAAKSAVEDRGTMYTVGKMAFKASDNFLKLRLISGRMLYYRKPYLKEKKTPWDEMRPVVHYTGTFMTKPSVETLYGGNICAHVTQATARDLMAHALLKLDEAGFNVVMTVHDEAVAEERDGSRYAEFQKLMMDLPRWAEGFPINVECWCGARYRK